MKTWKELADETTAETIGEHLSLLNREDQFRFMKRALIKNGDKSGELMRAQTVKDWVRDVGVPELEKYDYIMKDRTIVQDLELKALRLRGVSLDEPRKNFTFSVRDIATGEIHDGYTWSAVDYNTALDRAQASTFDLTNGKCEVVDFKEV